MYSLFILLYYYSIRIAALFNKKAKLWVQGRKDLFDKLSRIDKGKGIVWFHCASLGEYEQGVPLIIKTKTKYPEYKILVTFFSPSGYFNYKEYDEIDYVFYLPIDTKTNMTKFINLVNPVHVVFVKYEFWYNTIQLLYQNNIPLTYICCNFRPTQYWFKWYGGWFRQRLRKVNHYFVQNDESKRLLNKIRIDRVTVTGDTRFDRVYSIAQQEYSNKKIEHFINNKDKVFIAGSTWIKDEIMLKNIISKHSEYIYIIAPHEVIPDNINRIKKLFNGNCVLYSEYDTTINYNDKQILIVDVIGILSKIYRYATVTYIGGGFGKGIHNILEPVAYNNPVIFGPKYGKYCEAVSLLKEKGGFSINNSDELSNILNKLNDIHFYNDTLEASKGFISFNIGATDKILNRIII